MEPADDAFEQHASAGLDRSAGTGQSHPSGGGAPAAAYDGMYEMPREAREPGEVVPRNLERLFHCLEDVVKRCPETAVDTAPTTETGHCRKRLPLGAMIVHLNDDHGWTREQIAEWLSIGAPGPAGATSRRP